MIQLVVLSGKGGTGKTTIAAALAALASRSLRLVLVDADVDASNLGLVLSPTIQEQHAFIGGHTAQIDPKRCLGCGDCAQACRFNAVIPGETYRIDTLACEGCAACFYRCPSEAIRMQERQSGEWFRSTTSYGTLFHAHLFPGQENSGKLVTRVRQEARSWALEHDADLILIDGPPGIGCPVIAATTGVDLALLVAEPTISGVHDLQRVLTTTGHFDVQSLACINKADINRGHAKDIESFCKGHGIDRVQTIPFDRAVPAALIAGVPIVQYDEGSAAAAINQLWSFLGERILNKDRARPHAGFIPINAITGGDDG